MPKTRQQKEEQVKNLSEDLRKIKGGVFVNFDGLKVDGVRGLRAKLREVDSRYTVVKRTLLKLALKEVGLDIDVDKMAGGLGIAMSNKDEVMPAKVVAEFAKGHETLKIVGGILENRFIETAKVEELAKLPSKDELLARVVGSINAPLFGFVNVLAGNLRGLVQVLNGICGARV